MSTGVGDGRLTTCRILSLDGGGIKGVFTAAFLAGIEANTGVRLASYFDLIVGTSTGALIALALADGWSAGEVLKFYHRHGPRIFPRPGLIDRTARQLLGDTVAALLVPGSKPRFNREPLQRALEQEFGNRRLGELKTRVVIPAFNAAANAVRLFKTPHHLRLVEDHRQTLVEAALATSAAPTYFAGFVTERGERFLDGGVWANCPAVVGIHEAIAVLGCPLAGVSVLSVGTTEEPFHVPAAVGAGGLRGWLRGGRLLRLALDAPTTAALAQAKLLCRGQFLRINRVAEPGRFELADASLIPELEALGREEARHSTARVQAMFLQQPAPAFEPPALR